jgi:hypothetical protein
MRRRIERSRARCGKRSASRGAGKSLDAEKQAKPADITPPESASEGD